MTQASRHNDRLYRCAPGKKISSPPPHYDLHWGFKATYDCDDVEATLFNELAEYDDIFPLFVTGHSLGGAMATLFATRYARVSAPDGRPDLNFAEARLSLN